MIQKDPPTWNLTQIEQAYLELRQNPAAAGVAGQVDLRFSALCALQAGQIAVRRLLQARIEHFAAGRRTGRGRELTGAAKLAARDWTRGARQRPGEPILLATPAIKARCNRRQRLPRSACPRTRHSRTTVRSQRPMARTSRSRKMVRPWGARANADRKPAPREPAAGQRRAEPITFRFDDLRRRTPSAPGPTSSNSSQGQVSPFAPVATDLPQSNMGGPTGLSERNSVQPQRTRTHTSQFNPNATGQPSSDYPGTGNSPAISPQSPSNNGFPPATAQPGPEPMVGRAAIRFRVRRTCPKTRCLRSKTRPAETCRPLSFRSGDFNSPALSSRASFKALLRKAASHKMGQWRLPRRSLRRDKFARPGRRLWTARESSSGPPRPLRTDHATCYLPPTDASWLIFKPIAASISTLMSAARWESWVLALTAPSCRRI